MSTLQDLSGQIKVVRTEMMTAQAALQVILDNRRTLQDQIETNLQNEQAKRAEIDALKVQRDDLISQISARAP